MQVLVLICALLLASCQRVDNFNGRASEAIVINEKCKVYIHFEFLSPRKNVWVCSSAKLQPQEDLVAREYVRRRTLIYEVSQFSRINHPPVEFKKVANDVYLNGSPMGDDTNAVVEADGKVFMGEFIRTFD